MRADPIPYPTAGSPVKYFFTLAVTLYCMQVLPKAPFKVLHVPYFCRYLWCGGKYTGQQSPHPNQPAAGGELHAAPVHAWLPVRH
jgi:hypothetical protein